MKKILLLLIALSVPFIVSASEFAIVDVGRLWEIASETGGAMLKGLLQIAGAIFVVLIMLSGFRIMASGGDREDKSHAKALLIFSVLALLALISFEAVYKFLEEIFEPLQ
ncbi:MAG: hypothetical protein MNSN_04330 [Minisyncoccus archaeiphilus]|uniref:hypothetical protein n=1 Tax=Minisyncoccus archaeiphilus TaxID=3238481 RepID=UPI002B0DD797|nr:MAG: hypothetical protein MNSN_04330 [Candidatus Parcubacteria bacterium]